MTLPELWGDGHGPGVDHRTPGEVGGERMDEGCEGRSQPRPGVVISARTGNGECRGFGLLLVCRTDGPWTNDKVFLRNNPSSVTTGIIGVDGS